MIDVLQTAGGAAMVLVLLTSAKKYYDFRELQRPVIAEDDEAVRKAEEVVRAFKRN
ncbi:hypothetical protein [Paenibacillus sp. FSL R7-0273]|uniref:hypothetical protein n=1 Tax=Paenibacillus sp. FSL R7-0273 TaxID=1536772 RepID=UPI000A9E123A|nr:hypothetical protein [Paenibacillus sp. FSL R7-0273]